MITIGVDPGEHCGWAICAGGVPIASGTHHLRPGQLLASGLLAEIAIAMSAWGGASGADVAAAAVESPIIKGGAGRASSALVTGARQGGVLQGLRLLCPRAALWWPVATLWRAELGLNGGTRRVVNDRVIAWARATTDLPLLGPRGAELYDEANAIALAVATDSRIARGGPLEPGERQP